MNLYADAANTMRHLMPRTVPGLPRVGGLRGIGVQNRNVGATQSTLNVQQSTAPVLGQPSMRLIRGTAGSAIVVLERNVNNADLLSDAELVQPFETWAEAVANDARSLMRGPLNRGRLRAMGHPYGRGTHTPKGRRRRGLGRIQGQRAGISNLAVINSQSGELARSVTVMVRRTKTGVRIEWHYDTEYAAYLAFGTIRMRAHGPFATSVTKSVQRANNIARDAGRTAYFRSRAMARLG